MRAEVGSINGFSGHADRQGLLEWLGHLSSAPKEIFLTHGEESAAKSLASAIEEQFGFKTSVPAYQSTTVIPSNENDRPLA